LDRDQYTVPRPFPAFGVDDILGLICGLAITDSGEKLVVVAGGSGSGVNALSETYVYSLEVSCIGFTFLMRVLVDHSLDSRPRPSRRRQVRRGRRQGRKLFPGRRRSAPDERPHLQVGVFLPRMMGNALFFLCRDSILRFEPNSQTWEVTDYVLPVPDLTYVSVKVPGDYLECEL